MCFNLAEPWYELGGSSISEIETMRVAIVHYHLEPGGVSRVVMLISQAMSETGVEHVVLSSSLLPSMPCMVVEKLAYQKTASADDASTLLESLKATAHKALGAAPDVWHFHNHSLGKNCLLAGIVTKLAEAGERVVLQIHDLAERGRPENYKLIADEATLYPFSPRIQYVFINSRDLELFVRAGLPRESASLLPNPIAGNLLENHAQASLLFAPIRAIRRKNIGELVLLSALLPQGARIAISRAPSNPEALTIYTNWKDFAASENLPIEFAVTDRKTPVPGAAATFEAWISHASHFISTSVEEGFGLPFFEAIACEKPLLGRSLPHLTTEHEKHGIKAGHLYDKLLVPIAWIELQIFKDFLGQSIERSFRAYRRPMPTAYPSMAWDHLIQGDFIDFGNLSEALQQAVIERLLSKQSNRNQLLVQIRDQTFPLIDWLAERIEDRRPTATLEQLAPYAPCRCCELLRSIYAKLTDAPKGKVSYLQSAEILSACLKPESFHFLLATPYINLPPKRSYRAAIFDIYGTLLIAPPGGVKPDLEADPKLRAILKNFGHRVPESPSTEIYQAVKRHHLLSSQKFPEVDLRVLWREVLELPETADMNLLVAMLEAAWHPAQLMPGVEKFVCELAREGISLGLLSNAQSNTLASLGDIEPLFSPELTILSYQHGMAKPSPELFEMLVERLAARGIAPAETLFIGNDPLHDIVPAKASGFQTALFIGHSDSLRSGDCEPDRTIETWNV